MSKTPLRAVKPGEKPTKRRTMTLSEAVESGNHLEILKAQRRDIVAALPDEKGPAKAALHRQLTMISKEIVAIEATLDGADSGDDGGDDIDDAFDASAI